MAINQYDNGHPVTMASEPAVAYLGRSTAPTRVGRDKSLSVDEYFDKVKKALDKRYENL
jgi:hypothetical protein